MRPRRTPLERKAASVTHALAWLLLLALPVTCGGSYPQRDKATTRVTQPADRPPKAPELTQPNKANPEGSH